MLGLYVHLPFCRAHCAYCPFVVSTDSSLQEAYVDALVREITSRGRGERVDTLFLGGGTPSHTAPAHLERIVTGLRAIHH
jgi:oxygen-independent coproporphyrinogen-3 oxidase